MHNVPAWVESARSAILLVVWAVLIIRIAALRRASQRPVLYVLVILAVGSLVIQDEVAAWIDGATGVANAGELAVALVALTDFAMVWWVAISLHMAGTPVPAWLRRAPLACAGSTAVLIVVFFVLTPADDRFASQAHGWWLGYAVVWLSYGAVTAVGAAAVFWRLGAVIRDPVLRVSVLVLAVGTSAEVPYLVVRAIRWFSPEPPSELALVGFWFSFARFVCIALGCSLAALEPLGRALLYWYRRQRLRGLWLLLRRATSELHMAPPQSRVLDLLAFGNAEELLHQRIIEIRDSSTFLYDGWASPQLLEEVARKAPRADRGLSVAVACWLEVARRDAMAAVPRRYHRLDKDLLPEVCARDSTARHETRLFLQLHQALQSRFVRDFADEFQRQTVTN